MKLTKTAISIFPKWLDETSAPESVQLLAKFAAARPGLDFGNYCSGYRDRDGRAAYFAESRRISRQLDAVRDSMRKAIALNVTDEDVIQASQRGRLTVTRNDDGTLVASYCAGQYAPTEYRIAAAALLDRAADLAYDRSVRETQS